MVVEPNIYKIIASFLSNELLKVGSSLLLIFKIRNKTKYEAAF